MISLTSISKNHLMLDQTIRELSRKFNSRNLVINESKTDEYKIVKNNDEEPKIMETVGFSSRH